MVVPGMMLTPAKFFEGQSGETSHVCKAVTLGGALAVAPKIGYSRTMLSQSSHNKEFLPCPMNGSSNRVPIQTKKRRSFSLPVIDAETTIGTYNTHPQGYVTALNNIEKGLEGADRAGRERQLQRGG